MSGEVKEFIQSDTGWFTLNNPKWLAWGQHLQALAQSGLTYADDPFDIERYEAVREIATDILATYTHADLTTMQDILHSQAGYATPKIDVRAAVFQSGKILLVKELADGKWTLPGGWADVNESPSEAVAREVREESGYNVGVLKLLAVFDRNKHGHPPYIFHLYKLFFQCKMVSIGEPSHIETGESAFFAQDEIPSLSLSRTTPEEVERMYIHYHNPGLPTDFD